MSQKTSSYFFFVLLFIAAAGAVTVLLPFLTPVLLGAAAAVAAYPAYRLISRLLGIGADRSNLAALISVVLVSLIILVPLFLVIGNMYAEIQSLYGALIDESNRSQVIETLNRLSAGISNLLFNAFPAYSFDGLNVTEYVKQFLEWIFANLDVLVGGLVKVSGYVLVFLISLFYFLRDGRLFKNKFVSWSPIFAERQEFAVTAMKRAVLSVFAGALAVSVIQGALTGLGFYLFGIPAPAVWGSTAAVASLVPGLGTSLVIVPGIAYLIITGQYLYAIGLGIWGVFAVGLVDNFLGPHLVGKGVDAHPLLILLTVLGGIVVFGPIGFVLGPLILTSLFALLDIYQYTNYANDTNNTNEHKLQGFG